MNLAKITGYLFILGLIIAIVAGIVVNSMNIGSVGQAWISVVFTVIGLAIGTCMSTSKKVEEEVYVILLVTVGLLIASNMGIFSSLNIATGSDLGAIINSIVGYIAFFSAAAIIVLAIRTIFRFHVGKMGK